jgi:proteic killer suppression protein
MDVVFRERKFWKQCNRQSELVRRQGSRRAELIRARLDAIVAATCLEDLRNVPGRLHELRGNRKGQLSFDLDHPKRLIFAPNHQPVPAADGGGLDLSRVTAVRILGIEDTHE